jgi:putative transposase
VKFAWIAAEKAEFTVTEYCRALAVSPSGYYAWRQRPESPRARRDRQLDVAIRASFEGSRRRYGRPRVWKDLHATGERVSEKRVARLMRAAGLRARARKRFRRTTMSEHDQPVAANVLARQFSADGPNRRWVGDTTEFVIGSSDRLYLAAILDLYSRFIVGWALSAVNDRHLAIRALDMALKRRRPEAGLLHHSDQGCTYASEDYQGRLAQHGITGSMSRRGNCYDNAVIESWFSTVKSEEGEHFHSYAHAKEALFDYIEVFYNQRRRHSTLGQISPAEFERRTTHAA